MAFRANAPILHIRPVSQEVDCSSRPDGLRIAEGACRLAAVSASCCQSGASFLYSPISSIVNLKFALALASDHDPSVAVTQLDLSNRPARGVDLPKNYRRTGHDAPRCSARRRLVASPDLYCGRFGVEVGLKHRSHYLSRSFDRYPTRNDSAGFTSTCFAKRSQRPRHCPHLMEIVLTSRRRNRPALWREKRAAPLPIQSDRSGHL